MDAPTETPFPPLETLIERLHAHGRLRVWSLIVTLFGDAVVPRGGEIALSTISDVMARIGVSGGAVRTALSRLAADHWVVRAKRGRKSFFRLDESGRHAFDRATRRIYAGASPLWDGAWTVAIAPAASSEGRDQALEEEGFIRVTTGFYLLPRTISEPLGTGPLADMLVIHGSSAERPEMLRSLWPSGDIAAAYNQLIAAYRPVEEAFGGTPALAPIDAMATRLLFIHDWRRVVLRDPGLPDALLPQNWPGPPARALARRIYGHLLAGSEAWLDQAGIPATIDASGFKARFGGLALPFR